MAYKRAEFLLVATIAILVATPVVAQVDCVRLDNHLSPTRYSDAWDQFLPTRFEVAHVGLGGIQLRFDDGSGRIIMVFDYEQARQFVDLVEELLLPSAIHGNGEITFSALFEMGPRWRSTGPSQARAHLTHNSASAQNNDSRCGAFGLRFQRLIAADSPYTTYQPTSLHFTRELLTTVVAVITDGLPSSMASDNDQRCGYVSTPSQVEMPPLTLPAP